MSVKVISSSDELNDVAKGSDVAVVWVYDSDGRNRGFEREYEKVAGQIKDATFYKAGDQDIKDAKKEHGLDADWCYTFKDGKNVDNHREDHNAVEQMVKRHL